VPPSPSPTPAPTCPEAEITIDILTDNYPKEVSWRLVNTCEGDAIQESVDVDTKYQTPGTQYSDTYCVPSAEYRFEILDGYGDGICCSYGNGSYSVTYDGKVEASGGDYQSSETSTFGSCGLATTPEPTSAPTPLPTKSPINPVPTSAPSSPPTKEPTLAPTPPPTNVPTDQPTKSPTVVPTDRMLYCGMPGKCGSSGGDKVKASTTDRAGVRCCTTNESLGWPDKCTTKSDPRVFGESNVPTCYLESTFQEAVDICSAYEGGRLCTGAELLDRCTKGTGCQLNTALVWGCTPTDAGTCDDGAECCSGKCNNGICV